MLPLTFDPDGRALTTPDRVLIALADLVDHPDRYVIDEDGVRVAVCGGGHAWYTPVETGGTGGTTLICVRNPYPALFAEIHAGWISVDEVRSQLCWPA